MDRTVGWSGRGNLEGAVANVRCHVEPDVAAHRARACEQSLCSSWLGRTQGPYGLRLPCHDVTTPAGMLDSLVRRSFRSFFNLKIRLAQIVFHLVEREEEEIQRHRLTPPLIEVDNLIPNMKRKQQTPLRPKDPTEFSQHADDAFALNMNEGVESSNPLQAPVGLTYPMPLAFVDLVNLDKRHVTRYNRRRDQDLR